MKQIIMAIILFTLFINLQGQTIMTDKRDGNVYHTAVINGVTWMSENLKYKAKDAFFFDNDSNNMPGYGILYDWKTAQTACPDGWHLPSGSEFRALANYLEQKDSLSKILPDNSSFGVQLGGMQDYEGTFSEMEESCYYWTSTEYDKNNSEYFSYILMNDIPVIDVSRQEDIADIHGTEKSNKYSVRCVK
jgi:uncharacterized protein (TIGR02145 family)